MDDTSILVLELLLLERYEPSSVPFWTQPSVDVCQEKVRHGCLAHPCELEGSAFQLGLLDHLLHFVLVVKGQSVHFGDVEQRIDANCCESHDQELQLWAPRR